MNNEDDLQTLWKSQPPCGSVRGDEMLEIIEKKTRKFDRTIVWRNRAECIAAAIVVIFFSWTAFRAPNIVMTAGSLVVAGGAAWIIFYMLQYGKARRTADPSENLASYTQALVGRYDHQIRLLKSDKYWYLLPLYAGLLILSAGISFERAQRGAPAGLDLIGPVLATVVFGVVWWINEVPVVRRLRRERAELVSIVNQYEMGTGRNESVHKK